MNRRKIYGIVKFFDSRKGYGFVSGVDGREYYVHYSDIEVEDTFAALKSREVVEFVPSSNDRGPKARNVQPLGPGRLVCYDAVALISWDDGDVYHIDSGGQLQAGSGTLVYVQDSKLVILAPEPYPPIRVRSRESEDWGDPWPTSEVADSELGTPWRRIRLPHGTQIRESLGLFDYRIGRVEIFGEPLEVYVFESQ